MYFQKTVRHLPADIACFQVLLTYLYINGGCTYISKASFAEQSMYSTLWSQSIYHPRFRRKKKSKLVCLKNIYKNVNLNNFSCNSIVWCFLQHFISSKRILACHLSPHFLHRFAREGKLCQITLHFNNVTFNFWEWWWTSLWTSLSAVHFTCSEG